MAKLTPEYIHSPLFEHRFWLHILADHSLFIHNALFPQEITEIDRAMAFHQRFRQLLDQTKTNVHQDELMQLNVTAQSYAIDFREFKLHLIRRQLLGEIGIHLPPTFLNHMVNEIEEYLRILDELVAGNLPPVYPAVHHHILWLSDAIGHAATLGCEVDLVESKFIKKSKKFTKEFKELYLKAVEMAGFLRTNVEHFPALSYFNQEVDLEMKLFQAFLREMEEMRLNKTLLGTLFPLMADHMYREECYYILKLAQSGGLPAPDCDPTQTNYR